MPRRYTAVYQEERSEFAPSAKTPEGIFVVSIAVKIRVHSVYTYVSVRHVYETFAD